MSSPGFSKKIFPNKRGNVLNDIIKGNFIGSPTPLIKSSVFPESASYDENLESSQDWDLWIRISEHTEFEYVDEILAEYVVHGDQISSDFDKKIRSFDYIIKKHGSLYSKHKKALAAIYKKTAVLSLMNNKINNCRKRIIKAFTIDFLRADLFVHFILSFFPSLYRLYIDKFIAVTCGKHKLVY
jgi:hypothetical protein